MPCHTGVSRQTGTRCKEADDVKHGKSFSAPFSGQTNAVSFRLWKWVRAWCFGWWWNARLPSQRLNFHPIKSFSPLDIRLAPTRIRTPLASEERSSNISTTLLWCFVVSFLWKCTNSVVTVFFQQALSANRVSPPSPRGDARAVRPRPHVTLLVRRPLIIFMTFLALPGKFIIHNNTTSRCVFWVVSLYEDGKTSKGRQKKRGSSEESKAKRFVM